ncbi:MAG: ATP-binding protein [Boseongicola sp.]|nr:ATP-binding protein [Boseongicola sp.]
MAKRREVGRVRDEAETLKSEVTHVREDLERAESATIIAERRLWDSLETIRDGFAVFGPDNVLIAANRAYLSIFEGLDSVKPGIDMAHLIELLAEEGIVDTGGVKSPVWQHKMMRRIAQTRIEHATLKLWNGQYIQFIDRRTRDGDLVTLALNITEQKNREGQLSDARERAETASRAKSAFLANMSHEIRTPMNGVVAMADILAETPLSPEQLSYVETIRSSGQALLSIINDVLDYSKIEADKLNFVASPFDLERCVHDVVTLLRPGAAEKGLELAIDYDLFLPTRFEGDAGRIRQVLTNLVGNAIKFTEAGHILVRIVGLPEETAEDYVVQITVEDTGIGISKDKLGHVFREFEQVENDRNRTHDGTGLGLAITRKLVKGMKGDVWVDSTLGGGSSFGFGIPLKALSDETIDTFSFPKNLDRAFVVDRPGVGRDLLVKQLSLMGLRAKGADELEPILTESPGLFDLVFLNGAAADWLGSRPELAEGFRPGRLLILADGPTHLTQNRVEFDRVLSRTVSREALLDAIFLNSEAQPVIDRSDTVGRSLPGTTIGANETPTVSVSAVVAEDPTSATADDRRRVRVLAAEDNKTNRFVFEKMLKDLDIELEFVTNGAEAVEAFTTRRPDIFFTDISMPLMDGKEAARRIRAFELEGTTNPCPIVAMTAHAMDGDAEEILEAGIDFYLTKPLKKQALIDHILLAQPLDAAPALPITDDEPDFSSTQDDRRKEAG